jgi:hypothetical protein
MEEGALMMRRITLLLTVALVMALVMAVSGPAFATIHPLANSECASDNSRGVANEQEPPGLTPGGPDQSKAKVAQPVFAVSKGDPSTSDSPAFKTTGENIEDEFCPANK